MHDTLTAALASVQAHVKNELLTSLKEEKEKVVVRKVRSARQSRLGAWHNTHAMGAREDGARRLHGGHGACMGRDCMRATGDMSHTCEDRKLAKRSRPVDRYSDGSDACQPPTWRGCTGGFDAVARLVQATALHSGICLGRHLGLPDPPASTLLPHCSFSALPGRPCYLVVPCWRLRSSRRQGSRVHASLLSL